jgi:lipase chaperone LimK
LLKIVQLYKEENNIKHFTMEELLKKIQENHGLSSEQSIGVLNTIKDYIKEKFPMVESMVDNLFQHDTDEGHTQVGDTGSTDTPASKGGSFSDKI